MNIEEIRLGFSVVQWLVTCGVGLYAWNANRQAARAAEVNKLELRMTTIEEQMRHIPDQDLVHQLHGDMKAMRTEVAGLKDALVPVVRSLDRINDYLLSQK